MSRYFVLVDSSLPGDAYIVAEVARERADDGNFREDSLAANLSGENARIVTLEEVMETPAGRRALNRWQDGDDRRYYADDVFLGAGRPLTVYEGPPRTKEEIDEFSIGVRGRSRYLAGKAVALVEENRRRVSILRANLAQMRILRGHMQGAKRNGDKKPERHLRSVS